MLIDGVEGDISKINPADVESVTVLKDAAASALFLFQLNIRVQPNSAPFVPLDPKEEELIKTALEHRYNALDQFLNLSAFSFDQSKQFFIAFRSSFFVTFRSNFFITFRSSFFITF